MVRIRTGYSFRTAAGEISHVLNRLEKALPLKVAPITDRASTFGWVKWEAAAKKLGRRPVFGVELAVTPSINAKKPIVDYWTFLAIDSVEPINKLVERATAQFRYQPLLTYADAMEARGVFRIAGHAALFDEFDCPDGHTYYGLSPASAKGHIRRAIDKGLPAVAISDNFYPSPEDRSLWEVLVGRGAFTQSYDQHIQSDEEWCASVRGKASDEFIEDALKRRDRLWKSSTAELLSADIIHPERPATLRTMCIEAAPGLGIDLSDPVYGERLNRELNLIAEKNFEDYFYLVGDACRWARKNMAVGPARGSSCGSLACYLLGITTVDPIPHGLIFERFIDVNRSDLPDIDIDFSDQNRHKMFDYMRQKYGAERVARLGAVSMFKGRSALQEAGAALKIPRWKLDAVVDSLIERSSGDSRVNDALEDTLTGTPAGAKLFAEYPQIMIASRMEGHPRHYTQHAAGVVVAAEPITKYVAVDGRTNAIMADKYDAEGRLGLLKIDALGLTQLSVFEDALALIGMTMEDLQRLPLDDKGAFGVLNAGHFAGIFQWNGLALQSLTKQVDVDRFDDLVAISALARPGPLATGGASQWVKRRMGGSAPVDMHPLLAELTKDTYYVVIYQETVMTICRSIGNFTWAETAEIRKLMSKSLGNERFAMFEGKFIEGAVSNGMPAEIAKEIWDQINTFGSWAFNKSHAVAYGYISYWCCWLKAHHPYEFAAATLSHESDPDKQVQMLRELHSEGIGYVPVDRNISIDRWTTGEVDGKKVLVGPLSTVKGIGPALMNQIIGARARGEPLSPKAEKLLTNPTTDIDSLTPISDAVRRLMPDPEARNITTSPTPISRITPSKESYEVMVFCTPQTINPRDENEEANVKRRDGEVIRGQTKYLQMRLTDDSGKINAKINRYNFERLAQPIIDKGRPGSSLWAFKGKVYTVGDDFLVLSITHTRYIGDMEQS